MSATDDRIKKLPVWAQEHIQRLEDNLKLWKGRGSVGWVEKESEFCVRRYTFDHGVYTKYLPMKHGDTLLCNGVEISNNINYPRRAHISAQQMNIEPIASNCVAVFGGSDNA